MIELHANLWERSFLHLSLPWLGEEGLTWQGQAERDTLGCCVRQAAIGLVLPHHCVFWARLCCLMGIPSTEVPVLGIYGAFPGLLIPAHPATLALPCHRWLVVLVPSTVPSVEVVALHPLFVPRGSSLWLSIHRCPEVASS